jgi:hypothetical protein
MLALADMLPPAVEPVADPAVEPVAEPVEPVAEPPAVEPVAEPLDEPEVLAMVPVTSTRLPTRLLSSDVLPVRR